ncbi:MAG TPA: cyclic nucleotide-binding domain-containing protein [Herpetosiphonaceae bacterium]
MRKVLYILGYLSDDDIEWMLAAGQRRHLPPGATLIREGQASEALYIVLDGAVSIMLAALGGQAIDTKYSGELLGEMSFIDDRPASATVAAIQQAEVFVLERSRLSARLERDTAFAARFYRAVSLFLSDRLRHSLTLITPGQRPPANQHADAGRDELDLGQLDAALLAGARFERMLKRLMGG